METNGKMRRINLLRILPLIIIIIMAKECVLYGRTRNNAIQECLPYQQCSWTCNKENLLDENNNGVDDRSEGEGTWPFKKGETYTGEAYAWAGYSGAIKWGADIVSVFENRILDTNNKWIAGRASGDTLPTGYKGFAGIDCSGLVGNALDINRFAADGYKFNVSQIKTRCIPVKLEEMKKGDVFASNGHILLFPGNWVTEYSKVKVIHSVSISFSNDVHERKVIADEVTIKQADGKVYLWYGNNWHEYAVLSPFPQFSDFKPEEGEIIGDSKPEIKVKIKSGTNIKASSIVMKIDGTVVSPDISPSSDAKEINVSYTPTDDLSSGRHDVYKTSALT
jgi:hypothetical protein